MYLCDVSLFLKDNRRDGSKRVFLSFEEEEIYQRIPDLERIITKIKIQKLRRNSPRVEDAQRGWIAKGTILTGVHLKVCRI